VENSGIAAARNYDCLMRVGGVCKSLGGVNILDQIRLGVHMACRGHACQTCREIISLPRLRGAIFLHLSPRLLSIFIYKLDFGFLHVQHSLIHSPIDLFYPSSNRQNVAIRVQEPGDVPSTQVPYPSTPLCIDMSLNTNHHPQFVYSDLHSSKSLQLLLKPY
jgi:hypothetical protein